MSTGGDAPGQDLGPDALVDVAVAWIVAFTAQPDGAAFSFMVQSYVQILGLLPSPVWPILGEPRKRVLKKHGGYDEPT